MVYEDAVTIRDVDDPVDLQTFEMMYTVPVK